RCEQMPHRTQPVPVPERILGGCNLAYRMSSGLLASTQYRLPIFMRPVELCHGTAVAQGASNNPPKIGAIERTILNDYGVERCNNACAGVVHLLEQVDVLAAD